MACAFRRRLGVGGAGGGEAVITDDDRFYIYRRDAGVCRYCKKKLLPYKYENKSSKRSEVFSIDHVIPRSKGGPDFVWNLVVCCKSCNSKKGNKLNMEECAEIINRNVNLELRRAHLKKDFPDFTKFMDGEDDSMLDEFYEWYFFGFYV